MSLFGELPITEKEKQGKKPPGIYPLRVMHASDCNILGYLLLSKPASLISLEPLIVGCVFFNARLKKHIIRVKKLTFAI